MSYYTRRKQECCCRTCTSQALPNISSIVDNCRNSAFDHISTIKGCIWTWQPHNSQDTYDAVHGKCQEMFDSVFEQCVKDLRRNMKLDRLRIYDL